MDTPNGWAAHKGITGRELSYQIKEQGLEKVIGAGAKWRKYANEDILKIDCARFTR
jgi:hypothetical protein